MDEHFICQSCGHRHHIRHLKKRQTMPGGYCPNCAPYEQCAACGEMCPAVDMTYKHDVKNYICAGCENEYHEVMEYIKPAPSASVGGTKNVTLVHRNMAA